MRETEVLHKLKAENIHQAPLLLKATHFQKCNSYCEVKQTVSGLHCALHSFTTA